MFAIRNNLWFFQIVVVQFQITSNCYYPQVSQTTDVTISTQPTMSNRPGSSLECSSTSTLAKHVAPAVDMDDLPATVYITPKKSATKPKQMKLE